MLYIFFRQFEPINIKMSKAKRVCVIGAGPSGMSVLFHFNKLKEQGKEIPEIVCFDKQSDWGGLWKYSWETGKYIVFRATSTHSFTGPLYLFIWSRYVLLVKNSIFLV